MLFEDSNLFEIIDYEQKKLLATKGTVETFGHDITGMKEVLQISSLPVYAALYNTNFLRAIIVIMSHNEQYFDIIVFKECK